MVDLPWLNSGSSGYGGISSLLQAIPSIHYGLQGLNTGPQSNIVNQMQQVSGAQMDPSNPLYKKLYGGFREQGRTTLNRGINELAGQNRKLAAMGRVPLLDQERGGEQLWRGAMQGYQDSDNAAAMNTQLALGGAGRTLASAYQPASNLALQQNQSQYQKTKADTGIIGALTQLFGLH